MLQSLQQASADAGDFLEAVTKTDNVVCHFFHRDFERCKLLDKHLSILARKYFDTRFIKVSAPVSANQQHNGVSPKMLHICDHWLCALFAMVGVHAWSRWTLLPLAVGV